MFLRVITAIIIALYALVEVPSMVEAQPETARGMVVIDPRCCGTTATNALQIATQPGLDAISLPLPLWNSVTPTDLEPYLGHPIWHVYFITPGDQSGYSYSVVRALFEGPRQDGRSFASLVNRHPEIEWVIQIGNEPTVDFNTDAWSQRWWALAVYKELALDTLGHVDKPWRIKYPDMKWAVAVGTTLPAMQIQLQWKSGVDLGSGGVRDYYDYVSTHLYGQTALLDGLGGFPRNDGPAIYQYLVDDGWTHAILITEIGVNDPTMPMTDKVLRYQEFINTAPSKVKGVTAFLAGHNDTWPQYSIDQVSYGVALGNHW